MNSTAYGYKKGDKNKQGDPAMWTGGIDLGPHTFEIYQNGPFAVWHTPGANAWAGVGGRDYYPTAYRVVMYRIDSYKKPGDIMNHSAAREIKSNRAYFLAEFTTDLTPWRRAKTDAIAIAYSLNMVIEKLQFIAGLYGTDLELKIARQLIGLYPADDPQRRPSIDDLPPLPPRSADDNNTA